jgi:hypothetical protein
MSPQINSFLLIKVAREVAFGRNLLLQPEINGAEAAGIAAPTAFPGACSSTI